MGGVESRVRTVEIGRFRRMKGLDDKQGRSNMYGASLSDSRW